MRNILKAEGKRSWKKTTVIYSRNCPFSVGRWMLVLTEQYHLHVHICSLLVTRAHVLRALAQAFEDFSSGTGENIYEKG